MKVSFLSRFVKLIFNVHLIVRNQNDKNSFDSFGRMIMRDRILEKAEELFIKYGIKRVTMDEIAARLGISKKTIYQSFVDKNELVAEIFDKHIRSSQQNCVADVRKADNAVQEVIFGSETFCATIQSINPSVLYDLEKFHPDVFSRFNEFKNNFLYKIISQNLKRGMEEGLYRKDIKADIIAKMRLANILLATNIELFPGHQFTLPEVEREIVTHFLYGIVTPEGARIVEEYTNHLQTSFVHHTFN